MLAPWRESRHGVLKELQGAVNAGEAYVVVLVGAEEQMRNADSELPFRQDSNFFYVSGVDIPDARIVIDGASGRTTLYIPQPDESFGVWNGTPPTLESAIVKFQMDEAEWNDKLYPRAEEWLTKQTRIYTLNKEMLLSALPRLEDGIVDDQILQTCFTWSRRIKSDHELALIRHACEVSSIAHTEVMKACGKGLISHEYQLEATFTYSCMMRGLRYNAYKCIAGSGPNSAVLHYNTNTRKIEPGELVLLDAGAEHQFYASDITRTFPISGKFSQTQRTIYTIVLSAQKNAIAAARPGIDFNDIIKIATTTLLEGLLELGLIKGSLEELLLNRIIYVFQPHGLGHYMGLDVHDTTVYPKEPLLPGMCLTMEPGLYFSKVAIDQALSDPIKRAFLVPETIAKFENFGGIRIEDDIVITETGCEVLTTVPKEIEDIEVLMAAAALSVSS